jgi:hypothetical protein
MTEDEIVDRITGRMPLDEFLRIQERLTYLKKQEADKLKALAELQTVYVSANNDEQRDLVKDMVGKIRELSRKTREEIRSLNVMIHGRMELSEAKELYEEYLRAKGDQSPK